MIDALASAFSSSGVVFSRPSVPHAQNPSSTSTAAVSPFDQEASSLQISLEGRNALKALGEPKDAAYEEESKKEGADTGSSNLSDEEKEEVKELKDRDREVRQHEQAHLSAAGSYAKGGAHFEYTQGPDGKRYATSGHVNIDTSPIHDNPEATIQKAQVIKRAANAPAEPSGKDRQVASEATKMEMEARRQVNEKRQEETSDGPSGAKSGPMANYGQSGAPRLGSQINLMA